MKKSNEKLRQLCQGALFCALTAVCSQLVIPIGPVPVSLSLAAVFLCGLLLPVRTAVIAQCCYLALGAVGLPVFAGFGAGPARLAGPTGGFLVSYPLIVLLIALTRKKLGDGIAVTVLSMVMSLVVCYLLGTVWLCFFMQVDAAQGLKVAVLPFLPFDAAKIIFCILLAKPLRRALRQQKAKG